MNHLNKVMVFAALIAAAPVMADKDDDEPLDVETILSEASASEEYADTFNCLRLRAYRTVEIIDDRHLLFVGKNGMWINRLRNRCGTLRPDQILIFERNGAKLCDTDRVSGQERHGIGIPNYGSCMLGEFQEIDEQQALALKEAADLNVKTRRRKPDKTEDEA